MSLRDAIEKASALGKNQDDAYATIRSNEDELRKAGDALLEELIKQGMGNEALHYLAKAINVRRWP